MNTAYIIENNIVTNAIIVDENTDLTTLGAVVFPRTQTAYIGCTVIDGVVRDPQGNVIEPADESLLVLSEANAEVQRRIKELDSIGIFVWNSMSDEKKQALTAYHQALVDVPNQPGFPATIEWPVKPAM